MNVMDLPIKIQNTVSASVLNVARWEHGKKYKYASKHLLMKKIVILAGNGILMKIRVEVVEEVINHNQ